MAIGNSNDKYNARDYIYIVCKQAVYIRQLRMSGPIIAPLKVQMSVAWQIVCSGIKLYQYNPGTKEFVLMTTANAWYKTKFKQSASNKPSLMSDVSTMSLKSSAPVENDDDDDDDEKQTTTQNPAGSSNSKKKKNKNKQQYTAPAVEEVAPKTEDSKAEEDKVVEDTEKTTESKEDKAE